MNRIERDHVQLLLDVAKWYYVEGLDQVEIGKRIGYSRSRVSRLLGEARERRIVRFIVGHPLERAFELESQLVSKFDLTTARVAVPDADMPPSQAVVEAAAQIVGEVCTNGSVIGVSNGSTLSDVVAALGRTTHRDSLVIQMIGTLGKDNPLIDSPDITRRLAESLGCPYRLMPAPLVVGSERLATALRKEDSIRNALMLGSHADVALVGVGAFGSGGSGTIFSGFQSDSTVKELNRLGAVGHICGHHFDTHGRHIVDDWCARVMAVHLDRLRDIRTVLGVAYGPDKVAALRGALTGGYLRMLVTDAPTARALVDDTNRRRA